MLKKKAGSALEVRLLPHHYTYSFAKAEFVTFQTLLKENCLEMVFGLRWQHLSAWQKQLSLDVTMLMVLPCCLS